MLRPLFALGMVLSLAACGEGARPGTAATAPARLPLLTGGGLDRVMGQTPAGLTLLFGHADADVHEGTARKLQFQSSICVLDTYLMPPRPGAEPVVTYLDAREPDGSPIDRASCVAAMTKRGR